MSNCNINNVRGQEPGQRLYAGIDLALEKNVVVVLNASGQIVDRFTFGQEREGYAHAERRLEELRQRQQAAGVEVGMEPTNYLWKLLAQELEAKGMTYHLVNAYTVKKHREGDQLDRSKDDRRDAREIAKLIRQGECTQTRLQAGVYPAGTPGQVRRAARVCHAVPAGDPCHTTRKDHPDRVGGTNLPGVFWDLSKSDE